LTPKPSKDGAATLPELVTNGKPLRDRIAEALEVLRAGNSPEHIFRRSGLLARLHYRKIQDHNVDSLRSLLSEQADFVKIIKGRSGRREKRIVNPPDDLIKGLLCAEDDFPTVMGTSSLPIMSPEGELRTDPGYDPRTRLIYVPPAGFRFSGIPESPSPEDVNRVASLLREVFCDFPFADQSSLANTIAAVLTIALRPAIDGRVLIIAIDSPVQGTGKTLLLNAIASCATGADAPMSPPCSNDAEWIKVLTALAREGASIAAFDNLDRELRDC
jgi:hypothetical protein